MYVIISCTYRDFKADDEFLFNRRRLPCSWCKLVGTMCEQRNKTRHYESKNRCTIGWLQQQKQHQQQLRRRRRRRRRRQQQQQQQQQQNNDDDDDDYDDDDDRIANHKHKIKW